jgi:hypothetical protein
MASTTDNYGGYAAQCLALALQAQTPSDKVRLLQMAEAWRELRSKRDAAQKELH